MGGTYAYRTAWDAVAALLREHGVRGLFKGYWLTNSVRIMYLAPLEHNSRAYSTWHGMQFKCYWLTSSVGQPNLL